MEVFPDLENMAILIDKIREAVSNDDHQGILKIFEDNVEGYKS